MSEPAKDRRLALRDRLVLIAECRIADQGLAALRARDLAAEAGCAVGAIYNVFGDLTDLVLAVNARTFARLGAAAAAALREAPADPEEQLVAMARAYHIFAATNNPSWRALFDVVRPTEQAAPDWYLSDMEELIELIDGPVSSIFPTLPPEDRVVLTRTLCSAVHGVVLLSLAEVSAGIPRERAGPMIDLLVRSLIRGLPR
jgi:AcrR family transcriptional regulator